MKLKFWKKVKQTEEKRETVLQIIANEANMKEIYVKAQSPREAEELMRKLKEMSK